MYIQKFKDLSEDRDLYQKDIAHILNVMQAQYSRIETMENQLLYNGLIKLALFYDTSIYYILWL